MAYGAQGATDPYAADYTEMERRLALRQQAQNRQALESLASQGALTGGARQAREQEVNAGIGELWHSGAQAIESRRFAANEAERQRGWQTGERTGAQEWQTGEGAAQRGWQTGERVGTQEWGTGERLGGEAFTTGERIGSEAAASAMSLQEANQNLTALGAQFGYNQALQTQAESAAVNLQHEVDAGRMTQLEAEQAWQGVQNDLMRTQELTVQGNQITSNQWIATLGATSAMDLQNNGNAFAQAQAEQARQWGIDDRPWELGMWTNDAQLQMLVSGYNFNDDGESGGVPWFVTKGTTGTPGGPPDTSGGGSSPQLVWYLGRRLPIDVARKMGYTG
jgi:hypothetical protein